MQEVLLTPTSIHGHRMECHSLASPCSGDMSSFIFTIESDEEVEREKEEDEDENLREDGKENEQKTQTMRQKKNQIYIVISQFNVIKISTTHIHRPNIAVNYQ